jgi:DNA-binding transcriptional ArsR family regulator
MADDPLSLTFAALADPTRRAILARLADGEATVNELAEPFDMSLPAISKHLKVLERAGLISRGKDAQYRPCRLEAEPLDSAVDWIDHHRKIWEDRFDQLEVHIRNIQAGTVPERPATTPTTNPKRNTKEKES